jgi:hypothetical protein
MVLVFPLLGKSSLVKALNTEPSFIYGKASQGVKPSPIFNLPVSYSKPGSPWRNMGLVSIQR